MSSAAPALGSTDRAAEAIGEAAAAPWAGGDGAPAPVHAATRTATTATRTTRFDVTSGRPLTLPAFEPVETYPVRVEDGVVKLTV